MGIDLNRIIVKIPLPLQPLPTPPQREIPTLIKQLQLGQRVQARVLAQLQPSLVRLQLAATELLARTPQPLETGTKLQLQVVKTTPIPELRILQPQTVANSRDQAVRSAVSRQLPPQETRLTATALRESVNTPRMTEAIQRLDGIARDAGISPKQLNAQQIRNAVALSGLFHESKLLGGDKSSSPDTKHRLLQLLKFLRSPDGPDRTQTRTPDNNNQDTGTRSQTGPTPLNRLIRLVEASVSRIQLQQTAALPVEDSPRQAWQVDLPIHLRDHSEDVMLRIEHDEAADSSGSSTPWSVNLVFHFDTIGTLQCRVGLSGDRVATTFWSDRASTHAKVEQRIPTLQQALEAQGLEVVHLSGVHGEPTEPLIHVPTPSSLLDERA